MSERNKAASAFKALRIASPTATAQELGRIIASELQAGGVATEELSLTTIDAALEAGLAVKDAVEAGIGAMILMNVNAIGKEEGKKAMIRKNVQDVVQLATYRSADTEAIMTGAVGALLSEGASGSEVAAGVGAAVDAVSIHGIVAVQAASSYSARRLDSHTNSSPPSPPPTPTPPPSSRGLEAEKLGTLAGNLSLLRLGRSEPQLWYLIQVALQTRQSAQFAMRSQKDADVAAALAEAFLL
jgi:hypothetical protein